MADFDPTDFDGPGGGPTTGFDGPVDPLGIEGEFGAEDEDVAGDPPSVRDALLFVIDCVDERCLEPLSPGGRSLVAEALQAVTHVLQTKVVTAHDDRVGVVLFGVRERQNPNSFEGIYVLQELAPPSAPRIKQLSQEAARTPAQFEERHGCHRPTPLSDMLWTCTTLFSLGAPGKQFLPRVFFFTGRDQPCGTIGEQDAAETRARDLMDLGATLELFPLPAPGAPAFAMERFWGRVLTQDPDDYVTSAVGRIEELAIRVRRRIHRRRVLQRLPLELCPGTECAVAVYCHMIAAAVPHPVWLFNENHKPLKSETKSICEQTGGILHPVDDVETYVEFSGERVYMSRAELNQTKQFGEPGMKLLGFKAAKRLQVHHRVFHSYFVYPNERAVKGSAGLCAALIDRMLARKMMAIVRYVPRRNAAPVLAALLPQAEVEEADGTDQVSPPGFHMVLLPWADEIRRLDFPVPETAASQTPAVQEAARATIAAMRLHGFSPGCVDNPALQRHFASVQALALGEAEIEETHDLLMPDADAMANNAHLLQAWRESLDAAAGGPPGAPRPAKRAAPEGAEGAEGEGAPPARRGRAAAGVPAPTTMEEMRALVHSGEVERLTLGALKDWMKANGITASGKKSDLVERARAVI